MRPLLVAALVASLALTGLAAWWPDADAGAADDLLPATRAARPAAAALATLSVRPTAPAAATATRTTGTAATTATPAATPGTAASAAASAKAVAAAAAAAAAPPVPPAGLPTRAADWPAPGAAALAAWQGTAPVQAAAAAAVALAASATLAASAASAPPVPVFPYQWIGQLDDGGAPQALLASAQRSVAVRRGAVLDGHWRLDRAPGEPWKATHLPSGGVVAVRGAPLAAEP